MVRHRKYDLVCYTANLTGEGSLLLVAHSNTGSLHVCRIQVAWSNIPKPNQAQAASMSATLRVTELLNVRYNTPSVYTTLHGEPATGPETGQAVLGALTHLDVIPPVPNVAGTKSGMDDNKLIIMATYCMQTRLNMLEQTNQHTHTYSIIVRWTIQSGTVSLHNCFDKLSTKKKSVSSAITMVSTAAAQTSRATLIPA